MFKYFFLFTLKFKLCSRGRTMGGSSAINYMVYMRGHKLDYDGWAAMGNTGWSYDEVLERTYRSF